MDGQRSDWIFYGSFSNLYLYVKEDPINYFDPVGLANFNWSCCKNSEIISYPSIEYTGQTRTNISSDYTEMSKWTLEKTLAISWLILGLGLRNEIGAQHVYLVGQKWAEELTYKTNCAQLICYDPPYAADPVCNRKRNSEEWVILSGTFEDITMWAYWDLRDLDIRYDYGQNRHLIWRVKPCLR